jgi:translation initiation factor 1 (eIF-1/SUI1)
MNTNRIAINRTSSARRNQRGNALVFAMLGLVVSAIALATGINAYKDGETSNASQATISEVNAIIGNAKASFGQYAYSGLTTAISVNNAVIPSTMASGTSAVNRYSGAVTLVDNTSTTTSTALLSYANVPSEQCVRIITGTQAMARRVTVGGTDVKALDSSIVMATLAAQCSSATNVSISWTIGRT